MIQFAINLVIKMVIIRTSVCREPSWSLGTRSQTLRSKRDDLATGVTAHGVDLGAAPTFRIGKADVPNAIRFGTGAGPTREMLGQGLAVIADVCGHPSA